MPTALRVPTPPRARLRLTRAYVDDDYTLMPLSTFSRSPSLRLPVSLPIRLPLLSMPQHAASATPQHTHMATRTHTRTH